MPIYGNWMQWMACLAFTVGQKRAPDQAQRTTCMAISLLASLHTQVWTSTAIGPPEGSSNCHCCGLVMQWLLDQRNPSFPVHAFPKLRSWHMVSLSHM